MPIKAKRTASLILLFLASNALGNEMGNYSIQVSPLGGSQSLSGEEPKSGWRCTSSHDVQSQYAVADYKGDYENRNTSDYKEREPQLHTNPRLGFYHSREISNEPLNIVVKEHCRERYTTMVMVSHYDGKHHTTRLEPRTRYRHANIEWTCGVANVPQKEGQSEEVYCKKTLNSVHSRLNGTKFESLASKTMVATIKLNNKVENFTQNYCGSDLSNRKTVQIRQGVGKHTGEDDFVFTITVDGHTFTTKSKDGFIREDVAICTNKTNVDVSVTAIEKDLFFDDKYVGKNGSNSASIKIGEEPRSELLTIHRKSYTGWTPQKHSVRVTVYPSPVYGENPQQKLAERSTH